jgi:hypothetical protein
VTDVRAAVGEMRGRGVVFEEYDTPETRTENGIARMPGGGEAAWFKDSEGNLVGVVPAWGEFSRVSGPPRRVAAQRLGKTVCYRLTHTQNWWICVGQAIRAELTPSRAKSIGN